MKTSTASVLPTLCSAGGMLIVSFVLAVHNTTLADDPAVTKAMERGSLYIRRHQLRDGCWQHRGHRLGETALAGLALLAAGQPSDSPAVAAATRAVRQLALSNWETYDVSLAVMFLDRVGDREDSEIIRRLGHSLAAGQAANGCWTYSLNGSAGNGDNSNAQFAILACWICRRYGVAIDDTMLKADRYFRSSINQANGGWGYTPGSRSTPSMTCAGLVSLAAERGMALERSQAAPSGKRKAPAQQDGPPRDIAPDKNDPVVAAALTYLAGQLRQDRIESHSKPLAGFYFYWSLERVGVIYGIAKIRGVDWYEWGVERLLRMQRQDGGWGSDDCIDTAFAILFLAKANLAEDLTIVLGRWDLSDPRLSLQPQDTFLRVEKKSIPSEQRLR
jgi:hypothetical protein